jgi:hypothetical protein
MRSYLTLTGYRVFHMILRKTAIISLNTIDQLVFLMETGFEVETEFYVQFRSILRFKDLK